MNAGKEWDDIADSYALIARHRRQQADRLQDMVTYFRQQAQTAREFALATRQKPDAEGSAPNAGTDDERQSSQPSSSEGEYPPPR